MKNLVRGYSRYLKEFIYGYGYLPDENDHDKKYVLVNNHLRVMVIPKTITRNTFVTGEDGEYAYIGDTVIVPSYSKGGKTTGKVIFSHSSGKYVIKSGHNSIDLVSGGFRVVKKFGEDVR